MDDRTLMDLVERTRSRFYGKYRGTVTKVGTGSDLGRIKAKVPAVLGPDQETGWCMPCVPYAGKKAGIAFLPEENAGVWIEFEGGDVSYPIWVGCYWHQDEIPDRVAPEVKVIRTPGSHQIVLDDKDHVITISDANDNEVRLDRHGITILREAKPRAGKVAVTAGKVRVNDGAMEVT
jgi:uncharacterized protein involved in type VI secretion and phage assembly